MDKKKRQVKVRLDDEMYRRLESIAKVEDRSVSYVAARELGARLRERHAAPAAA